MRAMILAAGMGTRLKPLTESIPKALVKIKEHTLLELQIKKLKSEGFDEIIINVHHLADHISKYLEENNFFGCSISISDESDKLLDTGGGLKKASDFFSDSKPFLVYNVDILSNINLKKLLDFHILSNGIATVAVQERESSRKFLLDENGILCGWMNKETGAKIISKKSLSELILCSFSGIQIIDPKIFRYFPDKDVFSLVELYLRVASKEIIMGKIHNEDDWLDVGKIENLSEAENLFEKIRNTYQV